MKKITVALIASGFAAVAFAQAPATTTTTEVAHAAATASATASAKKDAAKKTVFGKEKTTATKGVTDSAVPANTAASQ